MSYRAWIFAGILAGSASADSDPVIRVGAGFGAGFGGLMGVGVEVEMRRAALLASVGYWNEPTFEIGGRYYFSEPVARYRPHATLTYAPTHEIKYGYEPVMDRRALIYGLNVLGGFDHDFGSPGGFLMTYALGMGLPGPMPDKVEDFYENAGQSAPEADAAVAFSLGIRYRF
jgi:hypothetical protein